MQSDRHFTRIDALEIKLHIGKKLGSPKAERYFGLLNRFFGLKLAKSEFDRRCIAAIGRENLCLHNHLIRTILKNACLSKSPPPKGNKVERSGIDEVPNGYQRSFLQSLCNDVFPQSPRKGRTPGIQDRKGKDCLSPLGPYGKTDVIAVNTDLGHKTVEQQSATELLSLGSRPPVEVASVEDGEEVDQAGAVSPGIHSRSPLVPPLGVPWNGKVNRKVLSSFSSSAFGVETCFGKCELPDSSSLKTRLEQKLHKEGLRVSVDCVNLLNNGLDTYLKRLIKPSLDLAGSRLGYKHNQTSHQVVTVTNRKRDTSASMLDFQTAMELSPQLLGEDWSMQLEKVCLRESEIMTCD